MTVELILGAANADLAARLTLLALRASIASSAPLAPDRVMVAPSVTPVPDDSAVRLLAALPKPVVCSAVAPNGVLVVTCTPLADAEAWEREWFRTERAEDAERGGYMGYLEQEHGPGDHKVVAFGRPGESLAIPRSVADRWHQEYELRGASTTGDDVNNPLTTNDSVYIEARRIGAAGLLRFRSPADDHGEMSMTVLNLSDTSSADARTRGTDGYVQMASIFTRMLDLIPDTTASAGDSVHVKTAWRTWQEKQLRQRREEWKLMANQMEHFFTGRAMPPEVAAFIAKCRQRC